MRKMLTFNLRKLRLDIKPDIPFFSRSMIMRLAWQSLAYLACPIPFLSNNSVCSYNTLVNKQVCYRYNDFLNIIQLWKLVLIVKMLTDRSVYATCSAHRVCQVYGVQNNITFVVKCIMKETPLKLIMTIFISGIGIFGYAWRIAESPLAIVDQTIQMSDFFTCCWVALLTMTTIGYGDLYPRTNFGRVIGFFCVIYGMAVVSLMVNFVSQELELNSSELKAFTTIKRLDLKNEIKDKAGKIVADSCTYSIMKKQGASKTEQRNRLLSNLIKQTRKLSAANSEYKATRENNPEEDIERNFALVEKDIKELGDLMAHIRQGIKKYKSNMQAQAEN